MQRWLATQHLVSWQIQIETTTYLHDYLVLNSAGAVRAPTLRNDLIEYRITVGFWSVIHRIFSGADSNFKQFSVFYFLNSFKFVMSNLKSQVIGNAVVNVVEVKNVICGGAFVLRK